MIKITSIAVAGVAAAASGAILGWMLTAAPVREATKTMMTSGALVQTSAVGDREIGSPAPAPAARTPAPAPTPIAQAAKPAPAPAPVAAAPKAPFGAAPAIREGGGMYKLDAGGAQVSLDPKRGQLRFKTPFGNISLDSD